MGVNYLDAIRQHTSNSNKVVQMWGVDFTVNALSFGETIELSKVLSQDGNEAEQSIELIAAMVTTPDGAFVFKTDEGKQVLKSKSTEDVKQLLDVCLSVAKFDTDKAIEKKDES